MNNILKHKKKILIIAISVVVCVCIVLSVCLIQSNTSHSVKFYSDNKELLKIDTVKSGKYAVPPVEPEVTYGNIFKKWDTDFSSVSKDLEIYPICESVNGKENVFALSGAYGKKGDVITTSLSLCGNVELSGFDLTVEYDKNALVVESVFDSDANVIYNNSEPGKVSLNYISIENTTADVDICSFKFKITDDQKETPLTIKVNKTYANEGNDLYSPKYNVINSNIYVY